MYQSPIDVIVGKMQTKFENGVLEAVQKQGIFVDKEELIKALQYDRCQYERGYADGLRERNEWISVDERLPTNEGKYLVCTAKGKVYVENFVDYYGNGKRLCFDNYTVTHWMPLPEPPKGE